jgi:hypothetical protein
MEHALWRVVPVAVLTLGLLVTPAGVAVGAAVAVGTAITASAFSAQNCTPTTVVVGDVSYYSCGGTWYTRQYSGGNVTYFVVNAPPGY